MNPPVSSPERIAELQRPEVAQLWGDGPVVVRAIERIRPDWRAYLNDDRQRRIRAWRSGSVADLDAMDRITIALDLTISDLEVEAAAAGEQLWTSHVKPGWNVPEVLRHEAVARHAAGETAPELARAFGVSKWTIWQWVERLGIESSDLAGGGPATE